MNRREYYAPMEAGISIENIPRHVLAKAIWDQLPFPRYLSQEKRRSYKKTANTDGIFEIVYDQKQSKRAYKRVFGKFLRDRLAGPYLSFRECVRIGTDIAGWHHQKNALFVYDIVKRLRLLYPRREPVYLAPQEIEFAKTIQTVVWDISRATLPSPWITASRCPGCSAKIVANETAFACEFRVRIYFDLGFCNACQDAAGVALDPLDLVACSPSSATPGTVWPNLGMSPSVHFKSGHVSDSSDGPRGLFQSPVNSEDETSTSDHGGGLAFATPVSAASPQPQEYLSVDLDSDREDNTPVLKPKLSSASAKHVARSPPPFDSATRVTRLEQPAAAAAAAAAAETPNRKAAARSPKDVTQDDFMFSMEDYE